MYSNKENVNTLTALLVAHGIRHAVVCPGSRNAPIVHNLNECPDITCHPVTDERSAGFFALGIAQATDEPVVVCVTSGTALLNLAPAVAEAHYQHQSLVVVSADRPAEWIDQLDGQTLRQPGALAPWVAKTVNLPVDTLAGGAEGNYCNRLVNEALIEATADHHPCVHINVPLSEPLFQFTVEELPHERVIRRYTPAADYDCLPQALVDDLLSAERPLLVFGQLSPRRFHYEGIDYLFSHVIVLHEALAPFTSISHFELSVESSELSVESLELRDFSSVPQHSAKVSQHSTLNTQQIPDFILYVGDAIVSKQLKQFLRQATDARTWRISLTGDVEDTFLNLRGIVVGDAERTLQSLSSKLQKSQRLHLSNFRQQTSNFRSQWLQLLTAAKAADEVPVESFSSAAVVQTFERQLQTVGYAYEVHYANSTPIRLANRYAQGHPVWCNRGTNGIDGSLSTAAGFAAVTEGIVFCVIGDLSFFYDQNALWNQHLSPRLRILLLNNAHGAIFDQLPGLAASPAATTLVAGAHSATAEGICRQNGVDYHQLTAIDQLSDALQWLTAATDDSRPLLLEVLLPAR